MKIQPILPTPRPAWRKSKWAMALVDRKVFLVNAETGDRTEYSSVDAAWKAKRGLES